MIRQKTSRKRAPVHRGTRGLGKVLVALDGSSEGESILDHLKEFLPSRSKLVLVHVIPTPPPASSRELQDHLQIEKDAEGYLERVRSRLPAYRSTGIVEAGDPADRLVAAARSEEADALAMTTHARSRLRTFFLGSVAREVVRRSGRPVFLVRPDVPAPRHPRGRILVPVAGPGDAEAVLRVVEVLARERNSEVVLLHVLPFPQVVDPVTGFNPIVLRPMEFPDTAWLDSSAELLEDHGIRVVRSVTAGDPGEIILREIGAPNVDLVVLRTRGRGGLSRLILGGVTEQVLQKGDKPVLLFHRVGA